MPAIPGSQLKNHYIEEIEGAGFKIKVVKQSGMRGDIPVRNMMVASKASQ